MKTLQKARYLRELSEELDLHGLYFQHVALCRRRAWLHLMGATHAIHNARVRRGQALHEIERKADRAPSGLGISPDGIDFERCVVIERKGGGGAREAVARQALFYAAFMSAASGVLWSAEIHVYGTRRKTTLQLDEAVLDRLIADAQYAAVLRESPCPVAEHIPLCTTCSCNGLCWDGV